MGLSPAQRADLDQRYERLKKLRTSTTTSLRPTPLLRQEVVGPDGTPRPLTLRYYQAQGVVHLLTMPRMVLGDATGLGKTLEAIATLCYLWEKEPFRVIIVTPKAALLQWQSEIHRFTTGVTTYVIQTGTGIEGRTKVYEAWANHPPDQPAVLLINYALLVRDWNEGAKVVPPAVKGGKSTVIRGVLDALITGLATRDKEAGRRPVSLAAIWDEATAFKNTATKTWNVVNQVCRASNRAVGLTATLLKNSLMEGFSIYRAIVPWVFPSKKWFQDEFCVIHYQRLPTGGKLPLIVGYKKLDQFRAMIDPYFLGRAKHVVSKELPVLVTRHMSVRLSSAEDALYEQALTGVLELGDGTYKDYQETKALTSLIYCQEVVNSMSLLAYKQGQTVEGSDGKVGKHGSKEALLVDLVTEELDGEKVIVYTQYASLVPRLQALLTKAKVPSVAITGKQNDEKRKAAQAAFQDPNHKVKVIFITNAGSEALNLQAASALVFYDAPWSFGTYVQILGRPIRIGSEHSTVVAYHLVAERPDGSGTIDGVVLEVLQSKRSMIEAVLGETAQGALTFATEEAFKKEVLRKMVAKGRKGRAS